MRTRGLPHATGRALVLGLAGLLCGCGGVATSTARVVAPAVTGAQAVAYARAVNLRQRDLPGFSGSGGEAELPAPGPAALAHARCTGGVSPLHRVAKIASPEFSAGSGLHSDFVKSYVEVWPTPEIVTFNNARSKSARGRACLVRDIEAVNRKINRERGGMLIGPFTVRAMPDPLPGVTGAFHTRIDETRLHRGGAVFFHVYRDLFGFISGPAEVELEAAGFVHPVPAHTEQRALRTLLERATTNAGELYAQTSP